MRETHLEVPRDRFAGAPGPATLKAFLAELARLV